MLAMLEGVLAMLQGALAMLAWRGCLQKRVRQNRSGREIERERVSESDREMLE